MSQVLKTIIILAVIGVILYRLGIIKNIPVVEDIPYVGKLELSDNCVRYNHIHEQWYDLSILFEESNNTSYSEGKLEIYYAIQISKSVCELLGEAYKIKDVIQDSTNTTVETPYDIGEIPLNFSGRIDEGFMILELSHKTVSNKDCLVTVKIPLSRYEIHDSRGMFQEVCGASSGVAKILNRTKPS